MGKAFALATCICCLLSWNGAAQDVSAFCATPPYQSDWLTQFQQQPQTSLRSSGPMYVPITIYLVGNDNGEGYLPEANVLDGVCTLNELFAATGIQFFIQGNFRYINNSDYFDHDAANTGLDMMRKYRVEGTVNTYIVESALDACGYNLIDRNTGLSPGIILSKSCVALRNGSWAHEMGHFLSLPHTFRGWEGITHDYNQNAPATVNGITVEKVDQSNCKTAGDGFCDTPPDYLNGRWYCDANGHSQITQKDPTGQAFTSDGTLIMGYAADPCANRFSTAQIAAMRQHLLDQRPGLARDSMALQTIQREQIQLMAPQPAVFVPTYDQVFFKWHEVPNAKAYILECSQIPTFAFVTNRFMVKDTSILINSLKGGRTYYWRVRPFNDMHTCRTYSEIRSFVTGMVTSARELNSIWEIAVYPNPAQTGSDLEVRLTATEGQDIVIGLLDGLGRTVFQQVSNLMAGQQTLHLSLPALQPGLYLLRLSQDNRFITRKVIIQP